MRFSSLLLFSAVPAIVHACEGDCIVGITKAFLTNYTTPVDKVIYNIANQISAILSDNPSVDVTLKYLQPILDAYEKQAYDAFETAIFPNYFHGKCLDSQGNEPQGCPNPDCPIVCGTPGSLVHFYYKLRYIAFNASAHLLQDVSSPESDSYKQVERNVLDAANEEQHVFSRVFPRSGVPINVMKNNKKAAPGSPVKPAIAASSPVPQAPVPGAGSASGPVAPVAASSDSSSASGAGPISGLMELTPMSSTSRGNSLIPVLKPRAQDLRAALRSILAQIRELLQEACGGDGEDDTNGLPQCSWANEMKPYILSFP